MYLWLFPSSDFCVCFLYAVCSSYGLEARGDPRQAKLASLLEDLDSEAMTRVLLLREQQQQLLKEVDKRYGVALIRLPVAIRKMNWLLYSESEEPKSPEVDNSSKSEKVAELENLLAEDQAAAAKALQKTSKKGDRATSSSEDTMPQTTAKKTRATKRPPPTTKKTRAQPASARKSNKKPLFTPTRNMLDSSLLMGATPLVTPRFDPRLPRTPAVRIPRHKERVYSISVNGSPIQSSAQDLVISVPLGNGESIQLLASQMDDVDLSSLDETALQSIRHLQSRLAKICEKKE